MGGGAGPPEELYVYVLDGKLSAEEEAAFEVPSFLGNWVEGDTSFVFFSEACRGRLERVLETSGRIGITEEHRFTYAEWQGGSFEGFEAEGIRILPAWGTGLTHEKGSLLLDPGVVFGNCLHPTTQDCVRALARAWTDGPLGSVLDLGTGSGVLALSAASLGARSVVAVDINPLCVKTARLNVLRNGLESRVRVCEGAAEGFFGWEADTVVANLHFDVIRDLVEGRAFKAGERVVLSGLLRSQFVEIRRRLEELDFEIVLEWAREVTWFTALVSKR